VRVGEGFAKIKPLLDNPAYDWWDRNAPIVGRNNANFNAFVKSLSDVQHHCAYLQLDVTSGLIKDFFHRYQGEAAPTVNEAYVFMEGLMSTFKIELDKQVFCYVVPHRTSYYPGDGGSPEEGVGHEASALLNVLDAFPNAQFDAREAAYCFAFERFTAAVYHLMRVTEHGLVAVALKAGAKPAQLRSWDYMLIEISKQVGRIEQAKIDDWVTEKNRFADFGSWFSLIRTGWRNPVSHAPRIYLEPAARGIFVATVSLFERLKQAGFGAAAMPATTIALPEDQL